MIEGVPDGCRQENRPQQTVRAFAPVLDRPAPFEHQHRRHHHRKKQIDEAEQRQQRGVTGGDAPDDEARLTEPGVQPQNDRIPGPAVQRNREIEGEPHGHSEGRQDHRQVKPGPRLTAAFRGGRPRTDGHQAGQARRHQRALLERDAAEREQTEPGAMCQHEPDGAAQEQQQLLQARAAHQQEDDRGEQQRRLDRMDQRQPTGRAPGRVHRRSCDPEQPPACRLPGLRGPPAARPRLNRGRGVQGARRKVDRCTSAYFKSGNRRRAID
jgi:hypothetical protein